jgi:DNA uptake protein ComE-like DNA-binding protein
MIRTLCTLSTCVIALEPSTTVFALPDPDSRVDINSASLDELLKIPGMTRTWAARIIRYRPYRGKNDLVDRGVVPSQVYNHIKDYIIAHRGKS